MKILILILMNRLISISDDLQHNCPANFRRFLYNEIHLKDKLIGIIGGKGVGKTSLLLQLMKNKLGRDGKALYVRLGDIYFSSNSLLEFARGFYNRGGHYLFVDDLHKCPRAIKEIDNIRIEIPDLHLVFASSIVIEDRNYLGRLIDDLVLYKLPGLSYREFLEFKYQYAFPRIQFDELIELNRSPGSAVLNRIRPLQYFEEYLMEGYYPFRRSTHWDFFHTLMDSLNENIERDLPAFYNIDYQSVVKIKSLVSVIAQDGPLKPNIEKLADSCGTTRDSLLKFLTYLFEARIIISVKNCKDGASYSTKPNRLFLNNSNLIQAICLTPQLSPAVYETFLMNQLQYNHKVHSTNEGVLIVDDEYPFDLEWRTISSKKYISYGESYSINEGIDSQIGTRIPLWMFGFLY